MFRHIKAPIQCISLSATFLVSGLNNTTSLKPFAETRSNKHCGIKKSFHTVRDTGFRLPIQFTAGFIHTFFPTHIRELMNLVLKLVLLILGHQLLLKLFINLDVSRCSSERHSGRNFTVLMQESVILVLHVSQIKWRTVERVGLGSNNGIGSSPGLLRLLLRFYFVVVNEDHSRNRTATLTNYDMIIVSCSHKMPTKASMVATQGLFYKKMIK